MDEQPVPAGLSLVEQGGGRDTGRGPEGPAGGVLPTSGYMILWSNGPRRGTPAPRLSPLVSGPWAGRRLERTLLSRWVGGAVHAQVRTHRDRRGDVVLDRLHPE